MAQHNIQLHSYPYQHQSSTAIQSTNENGFQQNQQRFTEDITRSVLQPQSPIFQESVQPENNYASQQLLNQNHLHSSNGFIQMPQNQEVCYKRQSILEAQMYEPSVTQTQAEQVIQNDSVSCLHQVQPTYFTSEQSQKVTDNPQPSYMSQEGHLHSQVNCHRNFTNHQQPHHSNESFIPQPYDDQHQNHYTFFNQQNEYVYYQQNQSATKSNYFTYSQTTPSNNPILQNQQGYICGSFEANNFQSQRSVNLFNRFMIL